ncbi:MAG: DUF1015 family protein [Anaerovoracaceae bacterium]|jgi:uncharacterized protein (DUF1015 family)|nr:DUF1015 family protein [Anaerovoracaceae bacterium]
MAIIKPFKGLRPSKELVGLVIALPYDVMDRKEASKMAEGNPYSFLHISRSEIDLPQVENPYSPQVYEKAKSNLEDFENRGVLKEEAEPTLYIYEQIMDGRTQVGIVATVSIDEYQKELIKKHEHTRVEKEEDRIRHFDTCGAHTEPVFLTYRENVEISRLINTIRDNSLAEYDITSRDGVRHILYKVEDMEALDKIVEEFKRIPALYIADGHHRCASAAKVGSKRRENNPNHTGEEAYNFFMAVVFPDSHLKIFDYNRVVKDLNGLSSEEFLGALRTRGFFVEAKGETPYRPQEKLTFGMYLEGEWYHLKASRRMVPDDLIGALDVSILSDQVLGPILGIWDLRRDHRIDFVGGIRGLNELEARCKDDMKVAFAVPPLNMDSLLAVADKNLVMPPKSTWFEPKLASGLFLHKFE